MKLRNLLLLLFVLVATLTANAQLNSSNATTHYAKFKKFFNDDICTELALPYSAMTDEQLREQMSDIAKELVDVAIKIKNDAWAKNEKEFRVAKFKPQTDPAEWDEKAKDLAGRFIKNFDKYTSNDAGKALVAAGPTL